MFATALRAAAIGVLLALLVAANWLDLIDASVSALEEGRVLEAQRGLARELTSAEPADVATARAYLQSRHLTQGLARPASLNCADAATLCRQAAQLARPYDTVVAAERSEAFAAPLVQGVDGHLAVTVRTTGAQAPMIVDTGSMATLIPDPLRHAVGEPIAHTRVSNFGRLVSLAMVRTAPFAVGDRWLASRIAMRAPSGFEREGVLGLDVLYALGGVAIDVHLQRVDFLGSSCPASAASPMKLRNGALTAKVRIDGYTHIALIDSGSLRTFVLSEAADGQIRVASDFGGVALRGGFRDSRVRLAGIERDVSIVHTADPEHFFPGTTALIGLDVLASGGAFGVCFEPARYWIR